MVNINYHSHPILTEPEQKYNQIECSARYNLVSIIVMKILHTQTFGIIWRSGTATVDLKSNDYF